MRDSPCRQCSASWRIAAQGPGVVAGFAVTEAGRVHFVYALPKELLAHGDRAAPRSPGCSLARGRRLHAPHAHDRRVARAADVELQSLRGSMIPLAQDWLKDSVKSPRPNEGLLLYFVADAGVLGHARRRHGYYIARPGQLADDDAVDECEVRRSKEQQRAATGRPWLPNGQGPMHPHRPIMRFDSRLGRRSGAARSCSARPRRHRARASRRRRRDGRSISQVHARTPRRARRRPP